MNMIYPRNRVYVVQIAYMNVAILKKPIMMFFVGSHFIYFYRLFFIIALIKGLNKKVCQFIRFAKQRNFCYSVMDCVNL